MRDASRSASAETSALPDPDFTPNPDRAIWIEGRIEEALLERLQPEISELTAQSREPITVFINSHGGMQNVAGSILDALRRTTPDDARVSRIITVAAPMAQSAAANLLSAGDWAVALPESSLLYHGCRCPLPGKYLTADVAREGRTLRSRLTRSSASRPSSLPIARYLHSIARRRATQRSRT